MHLDALIAALRDPAAFPGPRAPAVDVAQTHASVVFLAGDTAWKVKKPVNLGFLDFSTPELRRADCERELRLNRRMVPEVYRGLAAVVERDGAVRVVRDPHPGEPVVEWVVEMRRLPAEGMLDRLIPAGGVTAGHLEDFARRLAEFHRHADAGPAVRAHGAIDVLRTRQAQNLERLAAHAAAPTSAHQRGQGPGDDRSHGSRCRRSGGLHRADPAPAGPHHYPNRPGRREDPRRGRPAHQDARRPADRGQTGRRCSGAR